MRKISASLTAGSLVAGRFTVLDLAGRGGMGTAYRATDAASGQPVALKILHPDISNLFLRGQDVEQVVIFDFGIAHRPNRPDQVALTQTGAVMGTLIVFATTLLKTPTAARTMARYFAEVRSVARIGRQACADGLDSDCC